MTKKKIDEVKLEDAMKELYDNIKKNKQTKPTPYEYLLALFTLATFIMAYFAIWNTFSNALQIFLTMLVSVTLLKVMK